LSGQTGGETHEKTHKNDKHKINIIITVLIVAGFFASIMVSYRTYSEIIKDDIRNISKLSSSNIYSEINNELIKPIFVSLTMANDSFLKDWLNNESTQRLGELQAYLKGIETKYGYNSVFLVSDKTSRYYHFNGIHKHVSRADPHDSWYYDFVKSGKQYDLDVDIDEVTNVMTVFVNCKIVDQDKNFVGVVGVGLEMETVQEILSTFQDAYGLEAFLVDQNGLIQVHTNNGYIEQYDVHDDPSISKYMTDIRNNKTTLETYSYKENGLEGYLITRYVDELEWYLMVKKDTSVLRKSFDHQLLQELIIIIVVLLGVVLVSNRLIIKYEYNLNDIAKTDQLTKLLNRRGFDYLMFDKLKDSMDSDEALTVFIFDIDDFKKINDSKGHLFGDRVIEKTAKIVKDIVGDKGVVARWGGDEFAGYLHGDTKAAEALLEEMVRAIANEQKSNEFALSISVGMTKSRSIDTPDSVLGRADKALYQAKQNGKNQVVELT